MYGSSSCIRRETLNLQLHYAHYFMIINMLLSFTLNYKGKFFFKSAIAAHAPTKQFKISYRLKNILTMGLK